MNEDVKIEVSKITLTDKNWIPAMISFSARNASGITSHGRIEVLLEKTDLPLSEIKQQAISRATELLRCVVDRDL